MAEYFMPQPSDSYFQNILTWIRIGKRFRPRFPRAVQFQTLSTCNGKCVFCCHATNPDEVIHGRMDDSLIKKIIKECRHSMVGRISPYMTNEPLLDKRMPQILKDIKRYSILPVKTRITTNGALLDEKAARALIDAKLDQVWISVNGYSPESYNASMGLDFERVMKNIDRFLLLKQKLKAKSPRVHISTLRTRIVEPELETARQYWNKRDVKFHIHNVDNRFGDSGFDTLSPCAAGCRVNRTCDLFLKQAYIVENGDMIICCHDWKQSVVVGNIKDKSIAEVWNSDHFKKLIYEYYQEKFDNLEICRNCS